MILILQWLFCSCSLAGAATGAMLDGATLYGFGRLAGSLGMIVPAGNYFKARRQSVKYTTPGA